MNELQLPWPPPYTLRVSKRTRKIHLQITPRVGLELIVPHQRCEKEALRFLQKQKPWLERHAAEILQAQQPFIYPQEVVLLAIDRLWTIDYNTEASRNRLTQRGEDGLMFHGPLAQSDLFVQAMSRWLKQKAQVYLTPQMQAVSRECGLSYQSLSHRLQKTRWGSCNEQKNICLNAKLLFLRPDMVRYVMIHELCHTVYLDHSPKFWRLVGDFFPNYPSMRKQFKPADGELVPAWFR